MRFFDRTKEIAKLKGIEQLSHDTAQFTVITGRRRIGKTSLVKEAYKDSAYLYFFVSRKAEIELCQSFQTEIQEKLGIPMLGSASRFSEVFSFIMEIAETRHITLMIDEFQDFQKVNPSVFSEMQDIWDRNKGLSRINLIVCGSVNSMMNKIFRDEKEPLFGRQTDMIKVRPFSTSVLKEIMAEYAPDFKNEDLLALYLLTGGVAKYVELLVDKKRLTRDKMLASMLERDSYFIIEGKSMLIEEFGKEYGIYFSILTLISQGVNTRGEIEDRLKTEISGYLKKLLEDYELVVKHQPMFEKSPNKNVRYALSDKFLQFWFRFIFKYNHVIEAGGNDKLLQKIKDDYPTYSGHVLEDYFCDMMAESGNYTHIGYWHDRKGHNEIDIIAADEFSEKLEIYEVKRQEKELDMSILRAKADYFLQVAGDYKNYDIQYRGLSLDNM